MVKLSKRLLPLLLCLACILALLPAQVCAAGPEENAKLELTFKYDKTPISGVHYDLYYVATVDDKGVYTLTEDFVGYNKQINFRDLTSTQWKELATLLRTYAQRDKLKPLTAGETGDDGTVTFSDLKAGLYLAVGKNFTKGGYDYVIQPVLVTLPDANAFVKASAKFTRHRHTSPSEPSKSTVERKVLKSWVGEGKHPDAVAVQLLKNGDIYDTVTLNEANNWRHTWSNLEKYQGGTLIDWQVAEIAVAGYKLSITQEGVTFLVTNTKDEPETPPDEPTVDIPDDEPPTSEKPDEPEAEKPDEPTEPTKPSKPNRPTKPTTPTKSEKLPQTGAPWWPVSALAAGGLLCLILGVVTKKENEDA